MLTEIEKIAAYHEAGHSIVAHVLGRVVEWATIVPTIDTLGMVHATGGDSRARAIHAISGPLADRIGPRRVALGGVACMVLGLALASQARSLWQIYLAYGVGVGIGVGFTYVPAIGAVQGWFGRRRGLASGLAVAAASRPAAGVAVSAPAGAPGSR